jgi:homoserine dehydrogenase
LPVQAVSTRFQITLQVNDLPGVLASVATVFAQHGVSVETVDQNAAGNNSGALLTIMTHAASEGELEAVVEDLRSNAAVQKVNSVIRVEGI